MQIINVQPENSDAPLNTSACRDILAMHPDGIIVVSNDLGPIYRNKAAESLISRSGLSTNMFTEHLVAAHFRNISSIEREALHKSTVRLDTPAGQCLTLAVKSVYSRLAGADVHCFYFEPLDSVPGSVGDNSYLASHDALTSLLNRRGLKSAVSARLQAQSGHCQRIICFFIDINGVKNINESCGRNEGDQIITATASMISGCFRATDIVARIGGGKFLVLCEAGDKDSSELAYQRLLQNIRQYNVDHPSTIQLSVSVGVSTGDCASLGDLEQLITRADSVLYDCRNQEMLVRPANKPHENIFSRA